MAKQKKQGKIKKFFTDFKEFVTQGNILDLAIAVVIGGAFGKIVTSLVNDIIMPLVSKIVGGKSVEDWKYVITPAQYDAGVMTKAESAISYGNFIQTIIDFLIIAFFIFIALKAIMGVKNKLLNQSNSEVVFDKKQVKTLKKELKAQGIDKSQIPQVIKQKEADATAAKKAKEEAEKAEQQANMPPTSEQLLQQIRDILAEQLKKE